MESWSLIPIVGTLSIAAVVIVALWLRFANRRLLIQHGMLNEGYAAVIDAEAQAGRWTALRWGIVLSGFGAALVISASLHLDPASPAPWGVAALGAGLGYVAYFFASARLAPRPSARATSAAPTEPVR